MSFLAHANIFQHIMDQNGNIATLAVGSTILSTCYRNFILSFNIISTFVYIFDTFSIITFFNIYLSTLITSNYAIQTFSTNRVSVAKVSKGNDLILWNFHLSDLTSLQLEVKCNLGVNIVLHECLAFVQNWLIGNKVTFIEY